LKLLTKAVIGQRWGTRHGGGLEADLCGGKNSMDGRRGVQPTKRDG